MRIMLLALSSASLLLAGCTSYGDSRPGDDYRSYRNYDYSRPDPAYGSYDASRYYRDGSRYRERQLNRRDRIYRGTDNRYYCRRSDGTTGLIVGALAGGALGNLIAPGDSKLLGTILGAGAGAVIGNAVSDRDVRCR
jgi:outer membrane lipoprotein SlyB